MQSEKQYISAQKKYKSQLQLEITAAETYLNELTREINDKRDERVIVGNRHQGEMKIIEKETQGVLQNRADDLLEIEEDMRRRQETLELLEIQVEKQMKEKRQQKTLEGIG